MDRPKKWTWEEWLVFNKRVSTDDISTFRANEPYIEWLESVIKELEYKLGYPAPWREDDLEIDQRNILAEHSKNENKKLKARIENLLEAVEFYEDERNWNGWEIKPEDIYKLDDSSVDGCDCGGKKAREALAKDKQLKGENE